MPAYTIFYSWQLDTPETADKEFIRAALDRAVEALTNNPEITASPRIDSGMENVAGSPEVATMMFEQINGCALFVADLTLVGKSKSSDRKLFANPNVMIEMGF